VTCASHVTLCAMTNLIRIAALLVLLALALYPVTAQAPAAQIQVTVTPHTLGPPPPGMQAFDIVVKFPVTSVQALKIAVITADGAGHQNYYPIWADESIAASLTPYTGTAVLFQEFPIPLGDHIVSVSATGYTISAVSVAP